MSDLSHVPTGKNRSGKRLIIDGAPLDRKVRPGEVA